MQEERKCSSKSPYFWSLSRINSRVLLSGNGIPGGTFDGVPNTRNRTEKPNLVYLTLDDRVTKTSQTRFSIEQGTQGKSCKIWNKNYITTETINRYTHTWNWVEPFRIHFSSFCLSQETTQLIMQPKTTKKRQILHLYKKMMRWRQRQTTMRPRLSYL